MLSIVLYKTEPELQDPPHEDHLHALKHKKPAPRQTCNTAHVH